MSEMKVKAASSNQACAACKHQRRKCSKDCPLARYFPPDHAEQFQVVQSLYGVSNLLKWFNAVPANNRDQFIETMTYDAVMRQRCPELGSYATIRELNARLEANQREFSAKIEAMQRETIHYKQQLQVAQLIIQQQQQQLNARLQQQQVAVQLPMPQFGGHAPLPAQILPQQQQQLNARLQQQQVAVQLPMPRFGGYAPLPAQILPQQQQQQQQQLTVPVNMMNGGVEVGRFANEEAGSSQLLPQQQQVVPRPMWGNSSTDGPAAALTAEAGVGTSADEAIWSVPSAVAAGATGAAAFCPGEYGQWRG